MGDWFRLFGFGGHELGEGVALLRRRGFIWYLCRIHLNVGQGSVREGYLLETLRKYTPAVVIRPTANWEDRRYHLKGSEGKDVEKCQNHQQLSLRLSYCMCGSERIILVAFLKTTMPILL